MKWLVFISLLALSCGRRPHITSEPVPSCSTRSTTEGTIVNCGGSEFDVKNGENIDIVQTKVSCEFSEGTNIKFSRGGNILSDVTVCDGASVSVSPSSSCEGVTVLHKGQKFDICEGEDGASAYELYLKTNPTATEEEFLASLVGPKGAAGQDGEDGLNGTNGQNGASAYEIAVQNGFNGTVTEWLESLRADQIQSVIPVKLCSSDNSQFPEYGFKINGDIYAVYYGNINGGLRSFLAKLTPGTYVTTNGANCQFTITQSSSVPSGATHELLLCGVVSYKVSGGVVIDGTLITSNASSVIINGSSVSCNVTNPQSSSVSSSGGVGASNTQICNYNGIPSVNSTTPVYNTGSSSSGCYVRKL